MAVATGKLDALWYIAGIFFGILVYSEIQPLINTFQNSTSMGETYVWRWLGVSPGVILLLAVLMAIVAFSLGTLLEKKKGTVVPAD